MKICTKCHKEKENDDFALNKAKKSGRQSWCRECKRKHDRKHYNNNQVVMRSQIAAARERRTEVSGRYAFNFLKTHPCVDCHEPDVVVLDFDHVRGKKKTNVATLIRHGYDLEVIKKEIDKCDVRCANCHRRKTAKEKRFQRWIWDVSSNGGAAGS